MEKVKEISRPSFRLVRDGEHYEYHAGILQIVSPIIAKEYKMEKQRLVYERLFRKEDDAYSRNRGFEETKDIQVANKKRDEFFVFIKRTIENMRFHPDTTIKLYWQGLYEGLDPYKNAHRANAIENTDLIFSFIEEMNQEKYQEILKKLDLLLVIDKLKEANNKCNQLYGERLNEKHKRNKEEKMRNIRPLVDDAYFELMKFINAIFLVSCQISKEEQVIQEIGDLIDKINVRTKSMQDFIIKRRQEVKSIK
ncbi:MAG: DUF6261 family protein [Tannerellaceae bacterium]|jgi:hypothetical protein|nr:DUF6261 family protein [Tannerellaceae bacterium]